MDLDKKIITINCTKKQLSLIVKILNIANMRIWFGGKPKRENWWMIEIDDYRIHICERHTQNDNNFYSTLTLLRDYRKNIKWMHNDC